MYLKLLVFLAFLMLPVTAAAEQPVTGSGDKVAIVLMDAVLEVYSPILKELQGRTRIDRKHGARVYIYGFQEHKVYLKGPWFKGKPGFGFAFRF